jgi:type IV secretion system protein VirD4
VSGTPLYWPWSWLGWSRRFGDRAPRTFAGAEAITFAGGLVSVLLLLVAVTRFRGAPASTAHGSARWAMTAELEAAGLLDEAGVVLCQTQDARFSSSADGRGGRRWKLARAGRLVRHAGPEHVLVFAPTRSGKGVGTVIPTLLSWPASVLVYDIKRELWDVTAGWRRSFSRCWRFEPTATGGVRYNPLLEVRRGSGEVRDAQTIAEILIDPEGKGEKDHWRISGAALLTGAILHVLYAESDKSLHGLAAFLSDPTRSEFETIQRMLTTSHLPAGPHPVVAQAARAMLSKSDNELSGVLSTAIAALTLYEDPIVAENTSRSDFRIADLMHADCPASLYLVVPPSDLDRTRPLVRLLLNQIGKRLTERMSASGPAHRHRLLMLLDEFPTLGRLSFFESALAFSAGYGIKCLLVCQSLNQLEKAYGRDNSIMDNCHVRMAYTANTAETARRISDLVGQATVGKTQRSRSGKGLLGARSVSESDQEFARPLMTPDEVLRLPFEDALLFVGGQPPYRGRKVMYYLDRRLAPRAGLPPPDSLTEQHRELIGQARSDWHDLRAPAGLMSDADTRPAPPAPPVLRSELSELADPQDEAEPDDQTSELAAPTSSKPPRGLPL